MIRRLLPLPFLLGLALGARPQEETPKPEPQILRRKWDYKIMQRVYLGSPSGWINTMPWLISSPALGDLGPNGPTLEVVTGTEEGYGEWFPRGQQSGRYIAVSYDGDKLWDYATDNNAGRASPSIVDLDGDGLPECLGGSTSGWMIHCFDTKGSRRWRFESERNQNFLAAPASADLSVHPGLETVDVAADGTVYCVSASGKEIWSGTPGDDRARFYCAASPAIADLDGDGKLDVVVMLPSKSGLHAYALNGSDGKMKWAGPSLSKGMNTAMSSPAILPQGDPCWRRSTMRTGSAHAMVFAAGGMKLSAYKGATGEEVWTYDAKSPIVSSPALGDVDGDGMCDLVIGTGQAVICFNAYTGKELWNYQTGAMVYSSPALGSRERSTRYRRDWPMFRHDPQRTGFYGYAPGPLAVYVGSDDGYLHIVDGSKGFRIDRFRVQFPDLVIQNNSHGPLKFLSSPSLGDLDGNGTLEAVFTLVDRVWCVEDLGSATAAPIARPPPTGLREAVAQNTSSPRNAFTLAQVIHTGGWNPSVPVPSRMLNELRQRAKLDVRLEMRPVSLRDDEVSRFPFLYVTGHEKPAFSDDELIKLRGHLERGGFMLAEACCNSEAFHRSMRTVGSTLWPDAKLVKIDPSHPVFSKVYPMTTIRVQENDVAPEFEGIELKGRLAFLLTKHDYGCSWGNDCCTSACIGVAQEDSYRMMTNIVVTALTE